MARNFDRPTSMGATVADLVFRSLEEAGVVPLVVDVGARNGMVNIPASYARRADFVGFEPNPEEYEKLVSGNTDAAKVGWVSPRFKSTNYHPVALWSADEERSFYVTAGPGASTLMGEGLPDITRHMYLDVDRGAAYGDTHLAINHTIPMPCRRLDGLVEGTVDYLKLDVEGAEMQVLEGARGLFERRTVLFLKTEFLLTPYYEASKVLGHQHVFLDEMGLRMLDLDVNHSLYSRGPTALPSTADRRLSYGGDAIFVLDPDRNALSATELQRLAVISLVFGFNSFGVNLLRDAGLMPSAEIDAVEKAIAYLPLRVRLKKAWIKCPTLVSRLISRTR